MSTSQHSKYSQPLVGCFFSIAIFAVPDEFSKVIQMWFPLNSD
ncbi:hypothetical protein [Microcoleus sp. S13_C3]